MYFVKTPSYEAELSTIEAQTSRRLCAHFPQKNVQRDSTSPWSRIHLDNPYKEEKDGRDLGDISHQEREHGEDLDETLSR